MVSRRLIFLRPSHPRGKGFSMHGSTRSAAARVLLALASILALTALVAGQGAAATRNDVPPPYDQSDNFWSWPGAVLLHVGVSPAEQSAGYVVSEPYYI